MCGVCESFQILSFKGQRSYRIGEEIRSRMSWLARALLVFSGLP